MSEQPPTQWAITFSASGTVGKGTGPDPVEENE